MPLPDLVRKTAEKILAEYCEKKVPFCLLDQVTLRFETGDDCLLLWAESGLRQAGASPSPKPVAKFCYNPHLCQWTLHYPAGEGGWRFYLNATPSLDLNKLLQAVDEDPLGVFWD